MKGHFDVNNEVQVQRSHLMEISLSFDRKLVDNYFEIDRGKKTFFSRERKTIILFRYTVVGSPYWV